MKADFTRRQFLGSTGMGLAALGYGAGMPSMAAEGEGPTPKRGGVLTIGQDENPIGPTRTRRRRFRPATSPSTSIPACSGGMRRRAMSSPILPSHGRIRIRRPSSSICATA